MKKIVFILMLTILSFSCSKNYANEVKQVENLDSNILDANVIEDKVKIPQFKPTVEWAFPTSLGIESIPFIDDGTIFFGSYNQRLYSITIESGDLNWEFKTEGWITTSNPFIFDENVYFGSGDKNFYSLKKNDGSLNWKTKLDGQIFSSAALFKSSIFISAGRYFYSLSSSDGKILWKRQVQDDYKNLLKSTPILSGNISYWTSGNICYAIDSFNGDIVWEFDSNEKIAGSVEINDKFIFFCTDSGTIFSLNKNDGTTNWSISLGKRVLASPVLNKNKLLIGTIEGLYALDINKSEFSWIFKEDSIFTRPPLITNGVAYVGTEVNNAGVMFAIDIESGIEIWKYNPEGSLDIITTPQYHEKYLYFGTIGTKDFIGHYLYKLKIE